MMKTTLTISPLLWLVVAAPLTLAALAVTMPPPAPAAGPMWNALTPVPDRIILTWSADPATTQSITWRTDTTVRSAMVQYALASPGPGMELIADTAWARTETLDATSVKDARLVASYHSATLTGLQSDTLYAYRVGGGTNWSEWYHFRTASAEPEPFSFLYFGDAQNDILSLWSRNLRQSYASATDARFIIHAGDLVNNAHDDLQWGEWFRAGGWIHATVPSVPAPGNHEWDPFTLEEEEKEIEHFSVFWRPQFELPRNGVKGMEEANYTIDYQGLRILALSSTERREEQAAWMRRVLSNDPQPWTIATFHHPVFSSGKERDNPELRAAWKPVFDEFGIDLVLQGHDHTYARGRTAAGGENVADGINLRDATGPVYVVSVGGRKMYDFKTGMWSTYDAVLDRRAENTQLHQVIRIAGDTLTFRSYTAVGGLYDAFDLIRRDGAPNRFIDRMPGGIPTRTFADGPPYPGRDTIPQR
jgi:hypothetical protein